MIEPPLEYYLVGARAYPAVEVLLNTAERVTPVALPTYENENPVVVGLKSVTLLK